ncbi:MAG: hypothetical protein M5R36_08595 [Deltaproteobacteria bacterium]|nr:hypothetical protein [Deltaproteobacteria bacterium]
MKNAILPILLVVNLIVAALVGAQFFKGGDAGSFDPDEETKIAAALANRGLYAAAEGRLRRVSDNPSVSDDKRAGALYQIGTWHLERAKDPERALAAFVELRERFDKTDLAREAAKKSWPASTNSAARSTPRAFSTKPRRWTRKIRRPARGRDPREDRRPRNHKRRSRRGNPNAAAGSAVEDDRQNRQAPTAAKPRRARIAL